MTVPYLPTPLASPIVNPAIGSSGAPPIPYVSNSEFVFAPTGMSTSDLNPGGTAQAQAQALADTIRRATRWCDSICFGLDFSDKGASLAASLTVDSASIRIKSGELRLLFDYRPVIELVGVSAGSGLSDLSSIDPALVGLARWGRHTLYIPYGLGRVLTRNGDVPALVPYGAAGSVYAVWSYVNGYPHTMLAANVAQNATSCIVKATDGNGGVWGLMAASGAFPGSQLSVVDGASTERVFVQAIALNTPAVGQTTLTTTAFASAHTLPASPDFIPVTGVPEDVHQAVVSLTTMLIKTRGVRGLVMPTTPGGPANQRTTEKLGQAGALTDYEVAHKLLADGGFIVRQKHPGSY